MIQLFRATGCCVVLAAIGAALAHPAGAVANEDAVTYRINPTHTAQATMPDLILPLGKKWDIDLGVNATYPLIAGGRVFEVIRSASTANGGGSSLIAFDANTGHALWGPVALPASWNGWAAACYDNGKVFINTGGSATATNGLMAAYSATNGAALWSTVLPGQYDFSSAPTAVNGYVYTGGAGSGGTLYCVRESDGTGIWTGSVENGDSSSPAVTATNVYAGYACGQTFGFNALSGAPAWHLNTGCEGGGGSTSAFFNNLVFIRDYYNGMTFSQSAALDSSTGAVLKAFPAQGPMAFDNSMLFGIQNSTLTATRISNWTTAWTANNGVDTPVTAPTVVNGVVYVGTTTGKLLGYDENTGTSAASVELGATPSPTSESNTDLAAGDGLIIIPAGTHLIAVGSQYSIANLTPVKGSVIGGLSIECTVTMSHAAPVGGTLVQLASSEPSVTVPPTVLVPAGAASATFRANTLKVARVVNATLTASYNGAAKQSLISVLPDGLTSLVFNPTTIPHGGNSVGTLRLAYPAPAGGVLVTLSSSFTPLAQPSVQTVLIPAGSTTATFSVYTGRVLTPYSLQIGARAFSSTYLVQTVTLTP